MNGYSLLYTAFAFASVLDYSELLNIKEVKEYCEPYYARPLSEDKLKKVIAIFRHGDRAPLSLYGNEWANKKCITCKNSECQTTKCSAGLLTVKGFKQGKKLGNFIKSNYEDLLKDNKQVKGYCSNTGRTRATLSAVFDGLNISNMPHQIDKTLVLDSECARFRNILADNKGVAMDYGIFDNYMTSGCGHVPIQCNGSDCQVDIAKEALLSNYSKYTEIMENIRKDIVMNVSMFSELAGTILRELNDQTGVVLMAAHDSTISRMLSGLNISVTNVPSYASAIFIEVLEDTQGKEIIRVIYDGLLQDFGPSKKISMDKDTFIDYLLSFSDVNSAFREYCANFNSSVENKTVEYKKSLLSVIDPNLLHAFKLDNDVEVVPVNTKKRTAKSEGRVMIAMSKAMNLASTKVSQLLSSGKGLVQSLLAKRTFLSKSDGISTRSEKAWNGIGNLLDMKNTLLSKKKKSKKKSKTKKNTSSKGSSLSDKKDDCGCDNECEKVEENDITQACDDNSKIDTCDDNSKVDTCNDNSKVDTCDDNSEEVDKKCNCPKECDCMRKKECDESENKECNCALNKKPKKSSCKMKKPKTTSCSEKKPTSACETQSPPRRVYTFYENPKPQQCDQCNVPSPTFQQPCGVSDSPCLSI
ncbi:hypothetical protein PAEPH01_0130 [Pancytospora epiphaga]|nr:hypothetical protein PAEPH01_0130 [Pancytospora epiphaga]